ncbi:E3 ubiquitin-protein ligase UPL6 [Bienertia sinuspersici]
MQVTRFQLRIHVSRIENINVQKIYKVSLKWERGSRFVIKNQSPAVISLLFFQKDFPFFFSFALYKETQKSTETRWAKQEKGKKKTKMFFSGDPSARKRVDLGGRSSKERDRQKLLEQTRLERNRRLFQRKQNSAAVKIQKCYRAWKAVEAEHHKVREQFFTTYGKRCQNVSRHCFGPDSRFLCELLFFFNPRNTDDLFVLAETCRLLQHFAQDSGQVITLFAGMDYSSNHCLVDYRVKQLTYACIRAVHANRSQFKKQSLLPESNPHILTVFLEATVMLIDPKLSWACGIIFYLLQRNAFTLLREITLAAKESLNPQNMFKVSSLEQVLSQIMPHVGEKPCVCQNDDQWWSFSSQILSIPFLWQIFPHLKEVFARQQLCKHYMHQMSLSVRNHTKSLPKDVSAEYPSYACLLGNILEAAALALSEADSSFEMAVDLVAVATFLLDLLPPLKSVSRETDESMVFVDSSSSMEDDEMMDVEEYDGNVLSEKLESQISNAIDPRFLLQLIKVLLGGIPSFTYGNSPEDKEVIAVGSACAFLHVTFNTLPLERIMTILAYRTSLVPVLWSFMKRCHETQKWSIVAERSSYLPEGVPGWLLPLAVFCPVYKHMLMIVDNEEFYEQEKPLVLKDIRYLIVILRQALWQLLWLNPVAPSNLVKSNSKSLALKKQPLEFLQHRVGIVVADLLTQLQDWNNRRQFAPASDFHADGVNEFFISQAMQENTRAREIVKQAPFLVPFPSRVKLFASLLAEARRVDSSRAVFGRNRLKIRRDQILEDAFSQLSALSEDDLRERIRVTFINELGVEEAGVDGGGIFKDFMENVTRAAFDIQYGLFKETADHLLYPNPGSGLVHEQHLQFFRFLGTILAKAMFEGILVDIPFATFFLSKLKQKHNYLNDLPSLDPELYRHLIFLKHYQGDVSELELYFVILNNEYGEQTEEELLPGGKNTRVTNDNVIPFIHLVANHRLNYQIRQQSSHFLRGFQQLIRKEWIDMFNEHELQILISGSLDGLDIDDLRSHTQYSGGYHAEHYVIEMFWEVLKSFSQENQRKFLKFVTGCSRGPLLGFKSLEPQFCIQRAAGDASEEALYRLPTSATCMNLLKLPPYRSKEQLERKLLYAISSEAGFDLS